MCHTLNAGYYKVSGASYKVLVVEETRAQARGSVFGIVEVGLSYGDYGKVDTAIYDITGITNYNVEVSFIFNNDVFKQLGIITERGEKLLIKTAGGVLDFEKITEEEAKEVMEDGDPEEAPPTLYKIQPEN